MTRRGRRYLVAFSRPPPHKPQVCPKCCVDLAEPRMALPGVLEERSPLSGWAMLRHMLGRHHWPWVVVWGW